VAVGALAQGTRGDRREAARFHARARDGVNAERGLEIMTTTIDRSPTDAIDAASLIDLERYPIDDPDSARYRAVVARGRRDLAANGALALEGFITAAGLERLQAEAASLVPQSQFSAKQESPYGLTDDDDVPQDHPYRIKGTSQRHCAAHHKMPGTALDALYRWPPVRRLVAGLMAKPELFLHEDPSNALVLMIYQTGDQAPHRRPGISTARGTRTSSSCRPRRQAARSNTCPACAAPTTNVSTTCARC